MSFLLSRRAVCSLVALLVCLPLIACSGQALTAPRFPLGGTRVLFVGNSLTYTNDLPRTVDALARLVGDSSLHVASVAFPDFALEDHWAEGTARRSLTPSSWEFVVMQQGSSALPASQVHLKNGVALFAPAIRAAGAIPVLMMVWPTTARLGDFPAVLESYRNAAQSVGGIFAPAGDGWTALGDPRAMYAPDGLHPSLEGTYVAALIVLERLRGIRPDRLPATVPGATIAASRVRLLQQAATTALDRNPARPLGAGCALCRSR